MFNYHTIKVNLRTISIFVVSLIICLFSLSSSLAVERKVPSQVKKVLVTYVDPNFKYLKLSWAPNPKADKIDYYEVQADFSG